MFVKLDEFEHASSDKTVDFALRTLSKRGAGRVDLALGAQLDRECGADLFPARQEALKNVGFLEEDLGLRLNPAWAPTATFRRYDLVGNIVLLLRGNRCIGH